MRTSAHVQLLSRKQCCLCDGVRKVVEDAAAQGLCTWEKVDVDRDKALLLRYGNDVPVLLINGVKRFEHHVTPEALQQALESAVC